MVLQWGTFSSNFHQQCYIQGNGLVAGLPANFFLLNPGKNWVCMVDRKQWPYLVRLDSGRTPPPALSWPAGSGQLCVFKSIHQCFRKQLGSCRPALDAT
ncbi:MAG: hypothetical protein IPJ07_20420 [Acidobacteria bacterium]|nr:hypothetical protein [Acidobacteriota bacterium]